MSPVRFLFPILTVGLALAVVAAPPKKDDDDPNAPVSYFKKIRPIFQANCQGCHQPAKAKGGYVMTDFAKLLEGGEECAKDGTRAIVPKDPEKSLLVEQITPDQWRGRDAAEEAAARRDGARAHPPLDRRRRGGRHAGECAAAFRRGASARLSAPAGHHVARLFARRRAARGRGFSRGAAVEERRLGDARAAHRAVASASRASAFRPMANGSRPPADGPAQMGEMQIWDVEKRSLALSVPVGFDTVYGVELVAGRQARFLRLPG